MTAMSGQFYSLIATDGTRYVWSGDPAAPSTVAIGAESFLVLDGGTLLNMRHIVSMTPTGGS